MKMALLGLLASLLIVGCSAPAPEPGPNPEPAPVKKGENTPAPEGEMHKAYAITPKDQYTIGMSQCNLGEPWRVQMNADVKAAADKNPNLLMVFKDAQNDTLKQRSHIEEFVDAKVDAIIISPKESVPLTEPVAKAYKAGIPVIVLDRALQGDQFTSFIGADNVKISKALGEWLKTTLGGKGTVVELKGLQTSVPGVDRNKGFREGIAGSEIKVEFEADMKWLEPYGRKEMESALTRLPHIDAVYGHNDPGAHGAYLAAKAAGREKEMIFVGVDALPHEGVQYVKQGIFAATFQYPTGGAEAIQMLLDIFAGKEVKRKVVLGSRLFTKDNLEAGGEEIK